MELLIPVFTYLFVGLLAILLVPLMYAWVTKKIVVFETAVFKEYAYFWILLISFGLIFQVVYMATLQLIFGISEAKIVYLQNYSATAFVFTLTLEVILAKWIFRERFAKALKASFIYTVLLCVALTILFIAGTLIGFSVLASK